MEKEKMEIEKILEEVKEMLQKNAQQKLNAKVNVIVKGNKSEVEIEGTFFGMLIALFSLVKSIKEKFEKEMGTEDTNFLLETSFQNGMEETDE